jgi:TonB family protein
MGRLEPFAAGVFRAQSPQVGPAVVGVLRPRIVTPSDFEARFAADERELILAHEGVHLRRGDAAVNALACAVQCLCWFNPLAHLAARLMRIDQELACDARVIGRFPQARRTYAELLLKTQIAAQPLPLGCHWPPGARHPLKQRIAMLKSPLPEAAMRGVGGAVAAAFTLGAGSLAWAASPATSLATTVATIGDAERQAAQAADDLHPNYTCDAARERRGEGCTIVRLSNWLALPTHDDIIRHYPPAALKAGVTAAVTIGCGMTTEGFFEACAPVDTEMHAPDGVAPGEAMKAAFGQAAVAVSHYYQARLRGPFPRPWRGRGTVRVFFPPDATPRAPGPPGSLPALPPAAAAPVRRMPASYAAPQAPAPAAPPVIYEPDWLVKPQPADIADVYPPEALKAGLEGAATIACAVSAEGRLVDCRLLSETPTDTGFGAAALKLSERFQMKPMSRDGQPVAGGKVRIPFRFALPHPVQPVTPS